MTAKSTFLITGAAGFIGSCLVQFLNEKGYHNLLLCDDFGVEKKRRNWEGKEYEHIIERYNLFDWLEANDPKIDFVFHLGARTDTTEFDYAIHQELNVDFSQNIWRYCTEKGVPLVYASSAATYGAGELGYKDDEAVIPQLQPLNPYGVSKNEFDKWVLLQASPTPPKEGLKTAKDLSSNQETKHAVKSDSEATQPGLSSPFGGVEGAAPPFWAGLKFFNVYGPNEYHKGRMASVIWHSFNQIKKTGQVKLFKSHRPEYKDGQQLRDFIYVKDVVKVMYWFAVGAGLAPALLDKDETAEQSLSVEAAIQDSQVEESPKARKSENPKEQNTDDWRQLVNDENWDGEDERSLSNKSQILNPISQIPSAIYNLGTGKARSFYDLAVATFHGLDLEPNIVFIDMPEDIQDRYQYFTEANMHKLQQAGYTNPFYTLEQGVDDYVRNHLAKNNMY